MDQRAQNLKGLLVENPFPNPRSREAQHPHPGPEYEGDRQQKNPGGPDQASFLLCFGVLVLVGY